jgi:4-hydroxy-2-oxoheptanedioate aldolase
MLRSLQAEAGAAARAIKHRLRRGEPVLAIDIESPAAGLIDLLGRLGADMAVVDCARGPIGVEALDNLARAARLANLPLLARIPAPDAASVDRHLARGIDGILVPRLNTADQARHVLDSVRTLLPRHHTEKLVVAQIASAPAVAELDRFLDIDGIDAFHVSPVELATSLGYEGNFRHPEMQQVLDDILAAIRASGRTPGILVDRKSIQGYVRKGASFLYAPLSGLIAAGLKETLAQIQRVEEPEPAPAPAPAAPPAATMPPMPAPEPLEELLPEPAATAPQEAALETETPDVVPPGEIAVDALSIEAEHVAESFPPPEPPEFGPEDSVSSPAPDQRYALAPDRPAKPRD